MGGHDRRERWAGVLLGSVLLFVACSDESSDGAATSPPDATRDRCDVGFNTDRFNEAVELVGSGPHDDHHDRPDRDGPIAEVDFSPEEWAEAFVDEDLGVTVEDVVRDIGNDEIYRRHVLGGVFTPTLEPEPWVPMDDRRACEGLAVELHDALAAAARYPTVAEARADGYTLGDFYVPGLGVHFQDWGRSDEFDPGDPAQLLFDGTDDDDALVGLSYVVRTPDDAAPEGFTGDNDRWHRHHSFCLDRSGVNMSSDVLSEAECIDIGGTQVVNPGAWMLHVWLVAGCENDWGVFAYANTRVPVLPEDVPGRPAGCGSGRNVTDMPDMPIAVDRGGS